MENAQCLLTNHPFSACRDQHLLLLQSSDDILKHVEGPVLEKFANLTFLMFQNCRGHDFTVKQTAETGMSLIT